MKNKKRKRTCLFVILGLVAVLAVTIFVGYSFISHRVQANLNRPQVLIYMPYNEQVISLDTGAFLHATARSEAGISRIEAWADGEFIYAQESPESGAISPLVLHTFWQPQGLGLHEIIIRAYDANEVTGIASVLVEARETTGEGAEAFDPTGIIEAGSYPEDTEASDTPPDSGGSAPPGGSADYNPADPAPPPPEGEPPPEPLLQAFGFNFFEIFDLLDLGDEEEENLPNPSVPRLLRLEALELNTYADYDGVHCYVGMGGRTPTWYPDTDGNQDTDENFSSIGSGLWNIADYLADDNGVVAYWPGDEDLPFEINCIAFAGGGTEAIDLGWVEVRIPRGEWDGISRQLTGEAEGTFTLTYRINIEEPIPIALNPDVPAPFNVHIDERRQELQWEWERPEDFEGGNPNYLVFVNEVLVFQTHYLARAVRLPAIWFSPPCDTTYSFTVVAYFPPYPEGDYSNPSAPALLPDPADEPRTNCQPEFIVTFDTLVTGDLGGDDLPNNWANMVTPVQGSLFGNDQSVEFSNVTLLPNQTYTISELVGSGGWTQFVYEAQEDEYLRIGFDLIDFDDGHSQSLCSTGIYHDYTYNTLMGYGFFEDTIYSQENDGTRCQIHYTIQPLPGSPFGLSLEGAIPLPWIDVTDLRRDPDTGLLQVDVKNTGSAEWSNHTLWLNVYNRITDNLLANYQEDIFLDIGQETTVTTNTSVDNAGTVCVVVDPDETVLELYEHTGSLNHKDMRYCLPLPDLSIGEIQYNVDENKLRIKIYNQGTSFNNLGVSQPVDVYDLTVGLEPTLETTDFYSFPHEFGHDLLEDHDYTWIEWTLTPELREHLLDGYTITLDPENEIIEIDETNNSYSVEGGKDLRIAWDGIDARWYPNSLQDCTNDGAWNSNGIEVWVDVYARTALSSRHLGSWFWEGDIADTYAITEHFHGSAYGWNTQNYLIDAYINGEEDLVFELRGEQDNDSMGSSVGTFYNWEDWGITHTIGSAMNDCDQTDQLDVGQLVTAYPSDVSWSYCGGWGIYVNICGVH